MPVRSLIPRSDRESDLAIVQKAKKSVKKPASTVKRGGGLSAKIANIKSEVLKHLGQYADETLLIQNEMVLYTYITKAIEFGRIAIDTETTGLDPMLDECVGISLYVKGEKTVYIPLNHINYITGEKCHNQLPKEVVAKELARLIEAGTKIIMFNAPFDIRVILHQVGIRLHCWWDCSIGHRMLNENEKYELKGKVGLKKLHQKYVLEGKADAFSFDDLFEDVAFNLIPIDIGSLYAGHDAKITDEDYEFQAQYLYYDPECPYEGRNGMNGVSYTFFNIEMPIVDVVVDMEDAGVCLDVAYARELSVKYHEKEEEALKKFYDTLEQYNDKINAYIQSHPNCKLDTPIKISSNPQLAILFYDILGYESVSRKSPRGTGEKILKQFKTPLADAILEYRGIEKLIGTYIDKLPTCLNPNDNRLHCKFNQYGADTGRFSSSDPNLQNIPSHNKDIRPMFVASMGYVLLSSDFSQQEPKSLAALCRIEGDSQMYDTFIQGKDLYSEIASKAFHVPYEECLEHFPAGTPIRYEADGKWYFATSETCDKYADGVTDVYKDGKDRRTQAKSILLGVLYGRGILSIAEQLGCTAEEAQAIKDSVFKAFPAIKEFEERSLQMARELGYVTTVCGRKRRLPDLQLPKYEIAWEEGFEPDGDILDFECTDIAVPHHIEQAYIQRLLGAKSKKQKYSIIDKAKSEHLVITDNSKRIGNATRQCVNARIQGSAADLTKLAMIELYDNERLKELGFRMLIPVHDEIIAECPKENMKECSELLASIMSHAAEEILQMPIKCDVEVSEAWYGEKVEWDNYDEDEWSTEDADDDESED